MMNSLQMRQAAFYKFFNFIPTVSLPLIFNNVTFYKG